MNQLQYLLQTDQDAAVAQFLQQYGWRVVADIMPQVQAIMQPYKLNYLEVSRHTRTPEIHYNISVLNLVKREWSVVNSNISFEDTTPGLTLRFDKEDWGHPVSYTKTVNPEIARILHPFASEFILSGSAAYVGVSIERNHEPNPVPTPN